MNSDQNIIVLFYTFPTYCSNLPTLHAWGIVFATPEFVNFIPLHGSPYSLYDASWILVLFFPSFYRRPSYNLKRLKT